MPRTFFRVLTFLLLGAGLASALGAEIAHDWPIETDGEPLLPASEAITREARAILSGMSLEARAAQVLLIGVEGRGRPQPESLELVRRLGPGGVMLFSFNVPDEAAGLGGMIGVLQDAAKAAPAGIPLFMAIDHEGGSVFRFRSGLTRLPPPLEAGLRGVEYVGLLGRRAGLELCALGINLVLAPVVEVQTEGNRRMLGNRAFGRDPGLVDELSGAFIRGLQESGSASVAKHFPGNSELDPHEALPILRAEREILERDYYPRFGSAMDHGAAAVMLSHVLVPSIDARLPASLSQRVVDGELRGRLGFQGLVVTDDLFMKALGMPPERSAPLALAAGADLLMLSAGKTTVRVRDALARAVREGALPERRLDEAVLRILELKLRLRAWAAFDPERRSAALKALPRLVEESAMLLGNPSGR